MERLKQPNLSTVLTDWVHSINIINKKSKEEEGSPDDCFKMHFSVHYPASLESEHSNNINSLTLKQCGSKL